MLKFALFTRGFCKSQQRFYSNTYTSVCEILKSKNVDEEVTVKGWVKSLRNQKDNVFVDISDGSSSDKLQIFIPKALKPPGLATGASLIASGPLKQSPKGQLELSAAKVDIYGECVVTEGYPFAPRKEYTPEYIRQHLHFRPRTNKFAALLRVRNCATLAFHNYFNQEGFVNIHTPVLTSNDCEGAGEVFKVIPESETVLTSMAKEGQPRDEIYFNTKSFLTVSGQLHLEAAVHGLSKVYTLGPTFRAENSRSRLHLSEFYMLEAEIAFLEELSQLTNFVERMLKQVTSKILDDCHKDIESCKETEVSKWSDRTFPQVDYEEASEILAKHFTGQFNPHGGFTKEQEVFLVKHCGDIPVFIVNWPQAMKPFYMKDSAIENKVAAFDLLTPITGEMVGGSLREDNYNKLKEKLNNVPNLDWYLELRKFGSVPTGGFGLGFERYLQFLLGINNIKDVTPFPRWPHNCTL